tara:strand:- start:323 stop:1375 length:1053 start_codon:yes stop_codon:yes gene_type:complete
MSYIGTEPKDIRSFGRTQFDYTATQGQTAFTGADDDGKVLAFTVGQIEVYVNGILMDDSDFTTTGTGTVTLASAANLNDVINIVSFESNIPDNDYVPASGGTFTGNVTHTGAFTSQGIDDNANATAITIDSSERVAIGHTSPSASDWNNNSKLLHIKGNDTNGAIVKVSSSNADGVLAVGNNHLQFGTTSNDPVKIYTNSSQRLTIDSDGLKFGTDTAAANALDDYEEGTWTPGVNYGTLSVAGAVYTKVGNLVTVSANVYNFSDRSSGNTVGINSLPFTSASSGSSTGAIIGRYIGHSGVGYAAYIGSSSGSVYFYENPHTGDYHTMKHSDFATSTGADFHFTVTYRTN